jgi:hypothetical protein
MLTASRIDSQQLPNDFWARPLSYNQYQYNRFSLIKYGGTPSIEYIGFLDPGGNFRKGVTGDPARRFERLGNWGK